MGAEQKTARLKTHDKSIETKEVSIYVMKQHGGILMAGAAALAMPFFLIAPYKASEEKKAPFIRRNFAHRGLHTEDKSIPENSLAAFEAAAVRGYGIELDVQLSKDGQVVVFHDDTLNRVCGVDARVDEMTYEELQTLRLCETEYTIPLFSEVLACVDGRGPLIVELKTGKRNRELCEKTYALLKAYAGDYCIESFHPAMVAWFRFHAREVLRGQLAGPALERFNGKNTIMHIAGNCMLNFIGRPQFIAYCIGEKSFWVRMAEKMGAMRVAWTSHDPKNEQGNDAVIFEFYQPEIRY